MKKIIFTKSDSPGTEDYLNSNRLSFDRLLAMRNIR